MAIVEFDTDSAARTALLLSNALIVDRPITVSVHTGDFNASGATIRTAADKGGDLDAKPQHLPDEQRSKTSVVASLVAAGYVLSTDAIHSAQDYDKEHGFSASVKQAAETVKSKLDEVDQKLGVSNVRTVPHMKAAKVGAAVVTDRAKQVDAALGISEKASAAADFAKATGGAVATTLANQPLIHKASESISGFFREFRDETRQEIADRRPPPPAGQELAEQVAPEAVPPSAAPAEVAPPQ